MKTFFKTNNHVKRKAQAATQPVANGAIMKLRQNFDFQHLGQLFSISQQDASDIFNNWIQNPSFFGVDHQCYSDYKSCNTLKGLVGIDPRGSIIFASMPFAGSMSNKEINNQTIEDVHGLWENSQRGVMVDKGFKINEELEELGLKLNIPPLPTVDHK
ncbi:hypothetical protein MAR_011842 [Mya arenaria]|uniref:DDE Tnp4 domain-containing protein n=1 Tax=Mya arenaria TaxID=6604 RepID=A0ABY7FZ02_MYAAR|nr:hypothetical protein MAR_011842 [Mya arenaria]